jgi:hypothetical protein
MEVFMSAAPRPYSMPLAMARHEGIRLPLVERPGRHDVRVAGEHQGAARAAGALGPQVAHAEVVRPADDRLAGEAERLQARFDDGLALPVFGRHRALGNQLLGQVQDSGHPASVSRRA